MRVLFVFDGRRGVEDLLDLGDGVLDGPRLWLPLAGPLDHLFQAPAERQQQRCAFFTQMLPQAGIQRAQVFSHPGEQPQLLADRHMLGHCLLHARYEPGKGRYAGAGFLREEGFPAFAAEVAKHAQPRLEADEGFTLIETPGEPGGDTQVLRLGAQKRFADFAYLFPIGACCLMQGRGLAQFVFQ